MHPKLFSSFSNPIQNVIPEKGFSTPTESYIKTIPAMTEGKNVLLLASTAIASSNP